MDLKRAMLLRLARRNTELYPDDPVKREEVYNKFKVGGGMCWLSIFISKGLPHFCLFIFTQWTCFFFSFFRLEQQFEISEEEAEWVGLNLEEAVEKQRQLEYKVKHTHTHTHSHVAANRNNHLFIWNIRFYKEGGM